jgi:hypothetical protein
MVTIEGNTLSCKSGPQFFRKEREGIKRNTVRDYAGILCDDYTLADIMKCGKIKIINSETGEHFTRKIKDISLWHSNIIISW